MPIINGNIIFEFGEILLFMSNLHYDNTHTTIWKSKTWKIIWIQIAVDKGIRSAERRKVNVLEMKCLKSLVGVSPMDRVMGMKRCVWELELVRELARRADQRVLRWFGHVERTDEYRMARRVLMAEVSGGWVRGRPRLGWMDGVKVAFGNRRMTVEDARKIGKSGESCGT